MTVDDKPRQRRSGRSVTLKDVAKHAGVGIMTVSRAMNSPELVSQTLRGRIAQSVDELGYVRNRFAGGLASIRTKLVTVVVPSISSRIFLDIARGADSVLFPRGYQILLSNAAESLEEEEEVVRRVLSWRPDGVIISGIDRTPEARDLLRRAGVPVVEAFELGDTPIDINIGLSHYAAGLAAGRHLIRSGRRRIGYLGAQMSVDFRAQRRLAGFREALAQAGLPMVYEWVSAESTSFNVGAQGVGSLPADRSLDAVFCTNDEVAIGAIFECQRRQIAVPEDLAIIGFNDLDLSVEIHPRLTTIRTPREQIGRLAAQAIMDRIDGAPQAVRRVDVGFELIQRESA